MITYVSFLQAVNLQPGGSENGSSLVDRDRPDVTDELDVDAFGVIDVKLDWLGVVELLAEGKANRVFDGKEEVRESLGGLLVESGVMDGWDLKDDEDGSVNGEMLGEIEVLCAKETAALVMSLARVVFLPREEGRNVLLTEYMDELAP